VKLPVLGTLGAAAWTLPALAPLQPSLCRRLGVRRTIEAGTQAVALTFDDGPHPAGTPAVLAALERAGARATFFLVGEQVARHPALAREVAEAGHGVALHGDRHRCFLRLTAAQLRDDLARGHDAIAGATGVEPTLHRPPYGIYSWPGLAVARTRWRPVLWSRWARDWRADATPASIAERAAAGVVDGDVVLLHDADHYSAPGSHVRTAAALPAILDELARRGLRGIAVPG
jgi:peptidoglycan/xylan/chitin deacetylase (PgdA/CDA1 family)